MDDPVEKLAEQARELRLALTVRLDRSGKARDCLGTVKREFNLDELERRRKRGTRAVAILPWASGEQTFMYGYCRRTRPCQA